MDNEENNEYLLSMKEDDNLESFEDVLVNDIREQALNAFGEFTGNVDIEIDCFKEYIGKIFINGNFDDVIENFEQFSKDNGMEINFDNLTLKLVQLYKECIGVDIDVNREIISFNDLYSIYIVFVLSLKDTIISSTMGKQSLSGNDNVNITFDIISDYILSDEFSSNDDFIKNAAFQSENEMINRIKNYINDNVITIDHDVFISYVYDFIGKTMI